MPLYSTSAATGLPGTTDIELQTKTTVAAPMQLRDARAKPKAVWKLPAPGLHGFIETQGLGMLAAFGRLIRPCDWSMSPMPSAA